VKTILLVTATTKIVVVTIHVVVTIEIVTKTIWFASTKRLVEATKSFSP